MAGEIWVPADYLHEQNEEKLKKRVAEERMRQANGAQYLRARYSALFNNAQNARHWKLADLCGPIKSASKKTREKFRSLARAILLENHCYGRGILIKKVSDVIGTGPRLESKVRFANGKTRDDVNEFIERQWQRWARQVKLPRKLATMAQAKYCDGEAFGEFYTREVANPKKDVALDIRLTEADMWTDPSFEYNKDPYMVDGILHDKNGEPVSYKRLRQHPGDQGEFATTNFVSNLAEHDVLQASQVLHWFRADRPDQKRGVTEFAPALMLFGHHMKWVESVILAAEIAAKHAGVMYTDSAAFFNDRSAGPDGEPMKPEVCEDGFGIPLDVGSVIELPLGWKLMQLKAEQPTTGHDEFELSVIRQLAQCVQMPLMVAIGSSKDSNFSSSRLDWLLYHMANDVDRADFECCILDRIYDAFLSELAFVSQEYTNTPNISGIEEFPHRWIWPVRPPIDEVKRASAVEKYWGMGLLSDPEVLEEIGGIDIETHRENMKRTFEWRREIGAPLPGGQKVPAPGEEPAEESSDEEPDREEDDQEDEENEDT